MATLHVVGGGLAGLACAVRLACDGRRVALYEAAPQAGGRCRSFFDRALGCTIDNGNHLLLSGNRAALAYLDAIGARDTLLAGDEAAFPFVDLATGERWTLRVNAGRLPWWIVRRSRRVPGTRAAQYLAGWRLARAKPQATVADCLDRRCRLWPTFWDPLARAILNTPPEQASAALLWSALKESFALGGAGCRPLIARDSLTASLVQPALDHLQRRGATVRLGHRLRAMAAGDQRVDRLEFDSESVHVEAGDRVVLALPPQQVRALLPDITVPEGTHAIVNAHFRLPEAVRLPAGGILLGVVGGDVQWIFVRGSLVSLTVSAADGLAEEPAPAITERLWQDTVRALDLRDTRPPPARIIKERRATFAQTPAGAASRPDARTTLANLFLAGDWTATGLPATIESAIRSGFRAARLASEPSRAA